MNQPEPKPFLISKHQVLEAWKRVKANQGAGGVDEESIKDFEPKLGWCSILRGGLKLPLKMSRAD